MTSEERLQKLMTRHYPDMGRASDWMKQNFNLVPRALFAGFGGEADGKSQGKAPWGRGWQNLPAIRSTTQIWVVILSPKSQLQKRSLG